MSQFVISYIGGKPPTTSEESRRHFSEYKKWLQGLGEKAISPANPFIRTVTIDSEQNRTEGSSVKMSGYTVIEAEDMEAAIQIATSCPFLDIEGTLEVSELGSFSS